MGYFQLYLVDLQSEVEDRSQEQLLYQLYDSYRLLMLGLGVNKQGEAYSNILSSAKLL